MKKSIIYSIIFKLVENDVLRYSILCKFNQEPELKPYVPWLINQWYRDSFNPPPEYVCKRLNKSPFSVDNNIIDREKCKQTCDTLSELIHSCPFSYTLGLKMLSLQDDSYSHSLPPLKQQVIQEDLEMVAYYLRSLICSKIALRKIPLVSGTLRTIVDEVERDELTALIAKHNETHTEAKNKLKCIQLSLNTLFSSTSNFSSTSKDAQHLDSKCGMPLT